MTAFLWPRPSYDISSISKFRGATAAAVETAIFELFDTGYPVAVSSGRAGLALILAEIGLNRNDLVQVPPYASHCVLEAVSRVATPLAAATNTRHSARLLYHQWGYVQTWPPTAAQLIEDACDSLCDPGAQLFPAGGRFELWSLPKILGCSSGGIVWCRDKRDAELLRSLRNDHAGAMFQWCLRRLGARFQTLGNYWAGLESACGPLARLAAADILASIERWTTHVAMRHERLAMVRTYLPPWLSVREKRLPCVVPLQADPALEQRLSLLGITTGLRHFERTMSDSSIKLVKMIPLPIHQDMTLATLQEVLRILEKFADLSLMSQR